MLDNVGTALQNGLSVVATFIPALLLFLVILLIGWLIAKALRAIVDKVLERVGFDRVVERGGVGRAMARSKYDASDLIAALVYYAILLITLQLAFGVFGPNPISALLAGVVAFLPRLVVAIVIVVIAAAIAAAVKDIITAAMGGLSYGRALATIASVFIIGLGVIAALNQVGIATTVTLPVLITVLATIGGILVVGVGGGLIGPMRQRWEGWLNRAEEEVPQARAHAEAYQRGHHDGGRGVDPATEQPTRAVPHTEPAPAHSTTPHSTTADATPPRGTTQSPPS
ncbi:MAG: mechanosensitive ion channel family protein [Pseudonocardia sp.]